MSDSERPNPPAPSFAVPDLELEPVARSVRQAVPAPARPVPAVPAKVASSVQAPMFGASIDFGDDLEDGEFERTGQPSFQAAGEGASRVAVAKRAAPTVAATSSWPTGCPPNAAELEIDPRELAILADYGDPPDSIPHTISYAYRVFTRQRELKRQLIPIVAECERAQSEREATLAELSQAVRPALEQLSEFRRFLAPLQELERRAAARVQALGAINAQLGAESGQFDAELTRITEQLRLEQEREREAQQKHDEREANSQRAEAKRKRVQIEMRAVLQQAEQKLGTHGGQIPDPEATQLTSLRMRAEALEPEVSEARAALEVAKQVLSDVHARLDALRQAERQIARKRQALNGAYQKELSARHQGVSESEIEQRVALADLARALLAAPGSTEISEAWLERVRKVSTRADQLIVRAEMQRRAIVGYDAPRVRQGLRLACTAVTLLFVLFAFKLIF